MAFLYILVCADDTLYTGWTTDLARRLRQHNEGRGARYTRSRLPVRLAYWEQHPDRATAMRREATVKRWSRADKLRLIMRPQEALLDSNRSCSSGRGG